MVSLQAGCFRPTTSPSFMGIRTIWNLAMILLGITIWFRTQRLLYGLGLFAGDSPYLLVHFTPSVNEGREVAVLVSSRIKVKSTNQTLTREEVYPKNKTRLEVHSNQSLPPITKNVPHIPKMNNLKCQWSQGDDGSILWNTKDGAFQTLLQTASIHETFRNKSILLVGGSTTRDLAADFMSLALPPELHQQVDNAWKEAGMEGYQLFPGILKNQTDFHNIYNYRVMKPLQQIGEWEFEHLHDHTSGCSECYSNYTNLDYIARLPTYNISLHFTWKPDIYRPTSDETLFCNRQYDVVHIGRGLHDTAFADPQNDMSQAIFQGKWRKLAYLLRKCLSRQDPPPLLLMRAPYLSRQRKPDRVENRILRENTTTSLRKVVEEGAFGPCLFVDGYQLTSAPRHPKAYDGHHYGTVVHRTYWQLVTYMTSYYFQNGGTLPKVALNGEWEQCAVGARVTTPRNKVDLDFVEAIS